MASTALNVDSIPWASLTFLALLFVVEIICLWRARELYTVLLMKHMVEALLQVSRELGDSKTAGERLCGALLAIIVLVELVVVVGYAFHAIFTHADPSRQLLLTAGLVICAFPLIIGLAFMNHWFISWAGRRFPRS